MRETARSAERATPCLDEFQAGALLLPILEHCAVLRRHLPQRLHVVDALAGASCGRPFRRRLARLRGRPVGVVPVALLLLLLLL